MLYIYSINQILGVKPQINNRYIMKSKTIYLGIIQTIVGIGAIPAGLAMILDPYGTNLGMSTEILLKSPFQNFFIPGLFLFIVNGLFSVIGAILSFTGNKYAGLNGLGLGLFLIIWICVQIYFIGLTHFLQPLYFVIGIIEIILSYSFILRRRIN